mgnify:CR=1
MPFKFERHYEDLFCLLRQNSARDTHPTPVKHIHRSDEENVTELVLITWYESMPYTLPFIK